MKIMRVKPQALLHMATVSLFGLKVKPFFTKKLLKAWSLKEHAGASWFTLKSVAHILTPFFLSLPCML